jgi:integral membrane protein (TIGR01906 family)
VASAATPTSRGGRLASVLVSVATALVLLGVSILPFFTPQWIHGEQLRAHASVPGYSDTAVMYATDTTVSNLLFGGSFAFQVDPALAPTAIPVNRYQTVLRGSTFRVQQFFDDREVAHMNDVRGVFTGLALLIVASLVVLVGAALGSRREAARRAIAWRAVGRGATGLAGFMLAVGVLSIVAFDAMFQVFHELLFPAGSFTFDPARERLVQLFPDQFWSDTSLALGVLALVLSLAVVVVARRRASRLERAVQSAERREASSAPIHDGSPA